MNILVYLSVRPSETSFTPSLIWIQLAMCFLLQFKSLLRI